VRADDLALEPGFHGDAVRQEQLQLRHHESRQRAWLATRQPPPLGLRQQLLQRSEVTAASRQQRGAVAIQAVVAAHLRHHPHAAAHHRVQRHLAGQERHVDLVGTDGTVQSLIGTDGQQADRPANGTSEIRQQRLPVAAGVDGASQRQDAKAHSVTAFRNAPCRGHWRASQREQQHPRHPSSLAREHVPPILRACHWPDGMDLVAPICAGCSFI